MGHQRLSDLTAAPIGISAAGAATSWDGAGEVIRLNWRTVLMLQSSADRSCSRRQRRAAREPAADLFPRLHSGIRLRI
jgi:hypothetical protein